MAEETLVLTCRVADYDATAMVCSAPFYSSQMSALPTMSLADAQAIGLQIAVLWAAAYGIRMMKRALNETG